MDKYQPISRKTKISSFLFFLIVGLISLAGGISSIFYGGWDIGTDILSILGVLPIALAFFIGVLSIALAFFILKAKYQLTSEATEVAKQQAKEWEEKLMEKWYIRYPTSIFALGWAYVCYKAYINGLDLEVLKGFKYFLINPVTGLLMVVVAIFRAWEVSLIVITGVVLYYLYLGIVILPVSVAIIFGSIIIAYSVYKYKA